MPDVTNEGSPHPLSVTKSNFVCNDLNRQPPLFEHQPRRFNAKVLDGLGWRLRSFFVKRATKLTWTEPRNISERLDGKVLLQVKAGIVRAFWMRSVFGSRSRRAENCDCPPARR